MEVRYFSEFRVLLWIFLNQLILIPSKMILSSMIALIQIGPTLIATRTSGLTHMEICVSYSNALEITISTIEQDPILTYYINNNYTSRNLRLGCLLLSSNKRASGFNYDLSQDRVTENMSVYTICPTCRRDS